MDDIRILGGLYRKLWGEDPDIVIRLAGAGGDRRYYRLSGRKGTCIGTGADSPVDAQSFIALSDMFRRERILVPEILAATTDKMYYLQTDLGDTSLFSMLGSTEWLRMAEKAMKSLAMMQTVPEEKWIDKVAYGPFTRRQVMWDLNYFKYKYLKTLGIPFNEDRLEDDFEKFASDISSYNETSLGFMMRDCQSRNVMISDGEPWWIDFQGGRKGPVYYDVVSFLWQAKARLDNPTREHLLQIWREALYKKKGWELPDFDKAIPLFALARTLQVLGAYGFRGIQERRSHFIESIPSALENLQNLVEQGASAEYPELQKVCRYAANHSPIPTTHAGLLIKVYSFSYKRGYPEDMTGNGGGFMFDCRGLHNPGRYEEYKQLTGLDAPVREFLETKGEISGFLDNAWGLVSQTVECYLRRGFSDLQIGFGCTGGRHRSVYCADRIGKRLAKYYPEAEIRIIHREQSITETYPSCRQ